MDGIRINRNSCQQLDTNETAKFNGTDGLISQSTDDLHPEIVANVMRHFLLRRITSNHTIYCILGPGKTWTDINGVWGVPLKPRYNE